MNTHLETHSAVLLNPGHIAGVGNLIKGSRAENTESTYGVGWRSWEKFAQKWGYQVFPAKPETLAAWLAALVQEGRAPSTAVTYVRAVTDKHKAASLPSPLKSSEGLRRTLLGITRLMRDHTQRKARALSAGELMRLVGAASSDSSLRGTRDKAWWLLASSLGLRYSDSVLLERRDVTFIPDKGAVVRLRHSKTDQEGAGVELALASLRPEFREIDPVQALQALLAVLPEGDNVPLFQGCYKGVGGFRGTRITNSGLNKNITELAVKAGVPTEGLSSHSGRVTFVTGSYAAGVDEHAISLTGRWRSLSIQRSYRRVSEEERFAPGLIASDWLQRLVSAG